MLLGMRADRERIMDQGASRIRPCTETRFGIEIACRVQDDVVCYEKYGTERPLQGTAIPSQSLLRIYRRAAERLGVFRSYQSNPFGRGFRT